MPAPSEVFISKNPAPLNAFRGFPYRIDPFPARVLFNKQNANLAAGQSPAKLIAPNPLRKEGN